MNIFKKTIAALCTVFFCFAASFSVFASDLPSPSTTGALKVTGSQLTDKEGNPVQLVGASTHGIGWYPQYVNNDCFTFLKGMGCNVVRIAMYTDNTAGYCNPGDSQEALKSLVRSGVKCALNNDMYVIIDWHILHDGDPRIYQDEAVAFFDEMSKEFADCDSVLYEICNEPNNETGTITWAEIKEYAEAVIPVIRANDPDAVIIVGTPGYSSRPDDVLEDPITEWDNIMYTYHFYAASSNSLSHLEKAIEAGLPVFVTECNASSTAAKALPVNAEEAEKYFEVLDENSISYVFWSINAKGEIHSMLKPEVTKLSGFTYDDLSDTWQWLYDNIFSLRGYVEGAPVKETSSDEKR